MNDKCDLARMLREISEEKAVKSEVSRALSQDEIQRLVAERKKNAENTTAGNMAQADSPPAR